MVHVYTGKGKGKTTAGLGLALRGAGHGLRVEIVQFMKAGLHYGEYRAIKALSGGKLKNISINQFGTGKFIKKGQAGNADMKEARAGLAYVKKVLKEKKPGMIMLDEINEAMHFGLVKIEDIVKLIEKYRQVEMVLTGRSCPAVIKKMADYVTDMQEIKHPYKSGIMAREGIEY